MSRHRNGTDIFRSDSGICKRCLKRLREQVNYYIYQKYLKEKQLQNISCTLVIKVEEDWMLIAIRTGEIIGSVADNSRLKKILQAYFIVFVDQKSYVEMLYALNCIDTWIPEILVIFSKKSSVSLFFPCSSNSLCCDFLIYRTLVLAWFLISFLTIT